MEDTKQDRVFTSWRLITLLAVYLLSFFILYQSQFSNPRLYGVDGYYHIKMARLIRTEGLPEDFPWMQFSVFKEGYSDIEFLFHVALIPFADTDDPEVLEQRAKLAAVVLGAAFFTVFCGVLMALRCPFPLLWTFSMLFGAANFLIRLSMPRPHLLSLIILVIAVPLFARGRRRFWVYLIPAVLYTLSYPAPHTIIALACLFTLGRFLAGERPFPWRIPAWTIAGVILGCAIHPDPVDFLRLCAIINIEILFSGLSANSPVLFAISGAEYVPPALHDLFGRAELVIIPFFVLLLASLVWRRTDRPGDDGDEPAGGSGVPGGGKSYGTSRIPGDTPGLFLCSAAFLGLLLTGNRFVEYWVPFTVLFNAVLLRDLLNDRSANPEPGPRYRWLKPAVIHLVVILVMLPFWSRTSKYLHQTVTQELQTKRPKEIIEAAQVLSATAAEGDIIFHTRWSHFPRLFLYAPRQYYLVGLDPMYMKAFSDPHLDAWWAVRQGLAADPYPIVRAIFHSSYLLASKGQETLARRLEHDPRATLIFRKQSICLFKLQDRDLGFITSWLVSPEENAGSWTGRPGSIPVTEPGGDDPVGPAWAPYPEQVPNAGYSVGYVNFRHLFSRKGQIPSAGRAVTRYCLDEAVEEAVVRLGASGPFSLVINGEEIVSEAESRELALIDQYQRVVNLRAGCNTVLVSCSRTPADWGFFLRFTDRSGAPLTGSAVLETGGESDLSH